MRKELILILRFFCMDKAFIVKMLSGSGGAVTKEGQARFSEKHMHGIMQQVLSEVQDWLRELHTLHFESIDQRERIVGLESEIV